MTADTELTDPISQQGCPRQASRASGDNRADWRLLKACHRHVWGIIGSAALWVADRTLTASNSIADNRDTLIGRHYSLDVNCTALDTLKRPAAIIGSSVFDGKRTNVALPKIDFARYVLGRTPSFGDFDVAEFERVFRLIARIIQCKCRDGGGDPDLFAQGPEHISGFSRDYVNE